MACKLGQPAKNTVEFWVLFILQQDIYTCSYCSGSFRVYYSTNKIPRADLTRLDEFLSHYSDSMLLFKGADIRQVQRSQWADQDAFSANTLHTLADLRFLWYQLSFQPEKVNVCLWSGSRNLLIKCRKYFYSTQTSKKLGDHNEPIKKLAFKRLKAVNSTSGPKIVFPHFLWLKRVWSYK